MKAKIIFLFFIFCLFGCKKNERAADSGGWMKISERVQMKKTPGYTELNSGKEHYKIPSERLPYHRIIFLNASLLGYATELGAEGSIIGVSSPEYIYSENILSLMKAGKIENIGNEQKYDVEKIIALKPDAVFTNRIENFSNTYDLLRKNGIEIIFLDEYLEQNPLEKMAYLKVFGALLGKEAEAEKTAEEITSNYMALKTSVGTPASRPQVFCNEMYGAQWFMPGGKTAAAKLLDDAGADYILKDNDDDKAIPMSFEEVLAKSRSAGFWVNAGNHHSKRELLQINPNYEKLSPWQAGNIYSITGRERGKANDFFESGVVRADLVLKDYIKIFHPGKLPGYQLTYMKKLP